MSKLAIEIDELTADERLDLIERLWDSLRAAPGNLPLTKAQEAELDRRLDELDRDGPSGIPWDEVAQQIRNAHK